MSNLYEIIEEQKALTLAIDDPEIINTALQLAYYMAMLGAATSDPLNDAGKQREFVNFFDERVTECLAKYMEIVNINL